ncbi:hypothetical protein [Microbulbifer elongatus]|uniref:hypothetical protein n=1 Tax=Microbulbifer elongatus TaxID=86173 RepID=UPI001E4C1B00|nr:hypothetical protein [Microbulbifer elongatus]
MKVIGQKDSLHFVMGTNDHEQLRDVGIFYKDVSLTPVDRMAYVPQFICSMKNELEELRNRRINEDAFFLNLGPTTDDCSARIKLVGGQARISFDIEGGVVFLTSLPITYLVELYEKVINNLEHKNA